MLQKGKKAVFVALGCLLLMSVFVGLSFAPPPAQPPSLLDLINDIERKLWSNPNSVKNETKAIEAKLDDALNVMKLPISEDVSVWFRTELTPDIPIVMPPQDIPEFWYNASGFGHLHILAHAWDLGDSETITVWLYANIWNADHTLRTPVEIFSFDLTSDSRSLVITIPVPSETFYFVAMLRSATSVCRIDLSFYLTWA